MNFNQSVKSSIRPDTPAWCRRCAACQAAADRPLSACGCPGGHDPFGPLPTARDLRVFPFPPLPDAPAAPGCLGALGARLGHAFYYRVPMELLPRLSNRDVLAQAVAMTADRPAGCRELTWQQALALVASHLQHLVDTGDYAAATVDKMLAEMGMLATFMTDGLRKPFVADAKRGELRRWAGSRLGGRRRNGLAPADATVRVRLYSAKLFLRVLRRLGLYAADPLHGLTGPGRSKRRTQPLSDEAILLARFSCNDLEGNYLLPSALAVCEATATSRELWAVLVVHIDLPSATVQLLGTDRRAARIGYLSPWGVKQLAARIAWLQAQHPGESIDHLPVTYAGTVGGESGGVSAAKLLERVLQQADLAGQPGINGGSIAAAFGRRVWEQTKDLRLVGRALGRHTFDGAAAEIGLRIDDLPDDADDAIRAAVLGDRVDTTVKALRGTRHPAPTTPAADQARRTPARVTVRATRPQAGAL